METKLVRIAEISRSKPKEIFTSLYHLINKELLLKCHKEIDGKKAPGIDGVTKAVYAKNLEGNIENLVNRLKNKTYKPMPAKRVYIPKTNGKQRGLAIAIYEDKIVQMALTKIIMAVFEPKLLNNMYGFRPNKSCHKAIKELTTIIQNQKVSYIVDADIKGFFDNIDHEWLIRCVEQHIKDPNIINLINKFLKAGIMEEGRTKEATEGTPQGSILSPILANIYMHYVLVLWFEKKIKRENEGYCEIIVYADDYICCFQYKKEAKLFYEKLLTERLQKFKLELEPSKTRLIEFGKYAHMRNKSGRVETFDFLGFTFYCSKNRYDRFCVKVKTARKKFNAKLKEFNIWMKENRTLGIKEIINKVNEKLRGHIQYFGVSNNSIMINKYRYKVILILFKWINRRSQKKSYTWEEFNKILKYYPIVRAKVCTSLY